MIKSLSRDILLKEKMRSIRGERISVGEWFCNHLSLSVIKDDIHPPCIHSDGFVSVA